MRHDQVTDGGDAPFIETITKGEMTVNEMIRSWLKELYENAIAEAKGTIENERVWANGAPDAATAQMHNENIALQEDYIQVLTEKIGELN